MKHAPSPNVCHSLARSRLATLLLPWLVGALLWSGLPARSANAAPEPEPTGTQAEGEISARQHYARGEAAYNAGRYGIALSEFEAGYAAVPRPGFLLNMAHAERKLGELRKARTLYKKYLLVDPTSKVLDEVTQLIAELDSALADEEGSRRTADAPTGTESPPAHEPVVTKVPAEPPKLLGAPPPPPPAPVLVAKPIQPNDEDPADQPIYRHTWFWVTAGIVAVAAGSLAVYAWQRPASDPFHPDGSLGSVGP